MNELPSPDQNRPVSHHPAWTGGVILIVIGVVFLLANIGAISLGHNWWAWFILLGTLGAWSSAWTIYQRNGHRVTRAVTGPFIGGMFPLLVAAIFLFDLNWGMIWPVFLIIAGLAALVNSLSR